MICVPGTTYLGTEVDPGLGGENNEDKSGSATMDFGNKLIKNATQIHKGYR